MIAVTGGGTGGHIFPTIAVIEELRRRDIDDVIWIGERRGKEQLWAGKLQVPFYGIRTGKLRRYFSLKNFFDGFGVLTGICQSFFLLLRKKPDLLFSKGGFVSVPPVIAASVLRIPVVTHESDIIPGLATRIIALRASVLCVSFKRTGDFFAKKQVVYTGNPVRTVIKNGSGERGRSFLGFSGTRPVVTVLGGSLGASSINRAVWEMCKKYELSFNLVHQCGKGNRKDAFSGSRGYRQFEFIYEQIGDIIAASDLIISRAGAGALYEIGVLRRGSILVPLPTSKSRGEQIENACYFEENGASVTIEDEQLNGETLYKTITRLLKDKKALESMGKNAGLLCRPEAEVMIADIILKKIKNTPSCGD